MKIAAEVYRCHVDELTLLQRRRAVELWAHKILWAELEAEAVREARG